jgi:transcriptional regulator with XRE-family HTH domain
MQVRDPKEVGAILRELRLKKGKTQAEVADDLGISLSTYGAYETGARKPKVNGMIAIAKYYKRRIEAIFFAA